MFYLFCPPLASYLYMSSSNQFCSHSVTFTTYMFSLSLAKYISTYAYILYILYHCTSYTEIYITVCCFTRSSDHFISSYLMAECQGTAVRTTTVGGTTAGQLVRRLVACDVCCGGSLPSLPDCPVAVAAEEGANTVPSQSNPSDGTALG